MNKYILFLTILGVFYQETTCVQKNISCFMDIVRDALAARSTEYCKNLHDFEVYFLQQAELCSFKIDKGDIAMLVRRECLERPQHGLQDLMCITKVLSSNSCNPDLEDSFPSKISCLRILRDSYDCYVKNTKTQCGERASKSMRFTTQSFHIVLKHLCKNITENDKSFAFYKKAECFSEPVSESLSHGLNEFCKDADKFERYILTHAKKCSFEIEEEDAALFVQLACERPEIEEKDMKCAVRMLRTTSCAPELLHSMPFSTSSCLRGMWIFYDCLIKDTIDLCGEGAVTYVRYAVKALHSLLSVQCRNKFIDNDQSFSNSFDNKETRERVEL